MADENDEEEVPLMNEDENNENEEDGSSAEEEEGKIRDFSVISMIVQVGVMLRNTMSFSNSPSVVG